MRITKTTIVLLVLCFFTLQLKAKGPAPILKEQVINQDALQEAIELLFKDLSAPQLIEPGQIFNPLPPLQNPLKLNRPAKQTQEADEKSDVKPNPGKRKKTAPIVSPAKFRFGISDKEI